MAARTGAMMQRGMQKIQQNAPLINGRLETSQLIYQKAKAGYKFFQRMKEIIKNKKEENLRSENTQKSDLTDLMKQIQRCVPDGDNDQKCYSPCTKEGNTKYRWCYTSSEHRTKNWLACSCTIKKEVLEYLDVAQQNILKTPYPMDLFGDHHGGHRLEPWSHSGSMRITRRLRLFPTNSRRSLPGPRCL